MTHPYFMLIILILLCPLLSSIFNGLFGGLEGFECWCSQGSSASAGSLPKIQSGTLTINSANSVVTFPAAFTSVPTVQLTVDNTLMGNNIAYSVSVANVSKTGFSAFSLTQPYSGGTWASGNTGNPVTIYWQAVGT